MNDHKEQEHDEKHDGPPEPQGKVHVVLITFIIIVLAAVGIVFGILPRMHLKKETNEDTGELAQLTVKTISAEPGKEEAGIILPAEVTPMLQASIYARVDGYLKKWQADIGARVKAGDVLAEIETPETDRALDQARAEVNVADVNLKLAQATDTRSQGLLKVAAVSKQEADERTASLGVAQATVESQKANVNRLEELQSFQKVVAPFDGIVTARNVDIGDLISAGGTKELFHLAQIQTLRVYVRVPQTQSAGIKAGLEAELLVPEYPDKKFPAKVTTTAEAISPNSRTLLTELQVDNPDGAIRTGSYAQVRFATVAKPAVLTIPVSALIFRSEGTQVAVVKDGNKVELRNVSMGRDYGKRVELLDGVKTEDKIIDNPFDSIVDGQTVRVNNGDDDKKDAGKKDDGKKS